MQNEKKKRKNNKKRKPRRENKVKDEKNARNNIFIWIHSLTNEIFVRLKTLIYLQLDEKYEQQFFIVTQSI